MYIAFSHPDIVMHTSWLLFIGLFSSILSEDIDSPNKIYTYSDSYGESECGYTVGNTRFISGGEDTELGDHPWMALLRRKTGTRKILWHCGGVIVNKW